MDTDNSGGTAVAEPEVVEAEAPEADDNEGFLPQPEQDGEDAEPELDEDGNPVAKPEAEQFDEVEYEGKKYHVPPELKEALLRQSDYTRKTQELAELRRQIEPAVQQYHELTEAEQRANVEWIATSQEIARYDNIDWHAWRQTDPTAALQAQVDLQALHQQRDSIGQAYQQAQAYRLSIAQQETARRVEEGSKVLAEKIPDWGEAKQRDLSKHAVEAYGFDPAELAGIDDPRMILVLNAAFQFAASQKQTATAKKVQVQQAIKPAAKLAPGATPASKAGLHDNLSAEEWVRRRNAQVARTQR